MGLGGKKKLTPGVASSISARLPLGRHPSDADRMTRGPSGARLLVRVRERKHGRDQRLATASSAK